MKKELKSIVLLSFIMMLVLAGCGGKAGKNAQPAPQATNEQDQAVGSPDSSAAERLKIVATIYPMVEFTKQVVGDAADVIALIPAGVEPHDWEPSPKDIAQIHEADVFIYNGMVEEWAEKVLSSVNQQKLMIVQTIEGMELIEGIPHSHDHDHDHHEGDSHDHEGEAHGHDDHGHDSHDDAHGHDDHGHDSHDDAHGHDDHGHDSHDDAHGHDDHGHDSHDDAHGHDDHGHDSHGDAHGHDDDHADHHHHDHHHEFDPHVWLSPVLAQEQVKVIRDAMTKADPTNAALYEANAEAYIQKLKELDEAYIEALQHTKRNAFVVQHAAFGYLAHQYGLTQIPISGLSPEQEPSPAKMAEIIDFAKEHEITTIFFETLVDPKVAQTIANEIGAQTDILNPLEGLTKDDQDKQLDFLSIMYQNLEALKKALNE